MKPPGTHAESRDPWPQTARIGSRTPAPIWDFLLRVLSQQMRPTSRGSRIETRLFLTTFGRP